MFEVSKKLYFLIVVCLLALSQFTHAGQIEIGSGSIIPAPLPTVAVNGEGVASFNLSETAGENVPAFNVLSLPNVTISVDLERLGLKNNSTLSITGTLLNYFSVNYNIAATEITFEQTQDIPAFGFAEVTFDVTVLQDSTPAESLNGWVANISATDPNTAVNSGTERYTFTRDELSANDDTVTVSTGTPNVIPVLDNDISGTGSSSVTIVDDPDGIATANPDGSITIDVPEGTTGTTTITYQIEDESGETDTATVEVTFDNTVTAEDDSVVATAGVITNVPVLDNDDVDDGSPSVTISNPPGVGTASVNPDGTIDYEAPLDASSTITFTYQVEDADGDTDTATITLPITQDSDGDGIPNLIEIGDPDSPTDSDGDNTPDYIDSDSDNDGIPDNVEGTGTPNSPEDSDGDNIPDYIDTDSDDDGIPDILEAGGTPDSPLDSDGDNTPDYIDSDSDGDGIPDLVEGGDTPESPDDTDGDNTPDFIDSDSDADGIPDLVESGDTPSTPEDTDGDNTPDYLETDSDNDGISDDFEAGGTPETPEDTDGDNTPDYLETDSDNDGIPDDFEAGPTPETPEDTDGDNTPDFLDTDTDNDGIPDEVEAGTTPDSPVDSDGDNMRDFQDTDSDGDGIPDLIEVGGSPDSPDDTDGDNTPDYLDSDSDGDGIPDTEEAGDSPEAPVDTDGDNTPDFIDIDADDDGIPDTVEAGETPEAPVDTDGDTIPDYLDLDSDNDSLNDIDEAVLPDVDENGLVDSPNLITNTPEDTDGDNTPDYQETDSDNDGVPDIAQLPNGEPGEDANGDGVIDDPADTDGDGIPDVTDDAPNSFGDAPEVIDTDGDNTPDTVDDDDDNDGIPDVVEDAVDTDADNDGIPNSKETDSDGDGIPDLVEAGGAPETPEDTDGDNTPDYLETDSDNDGIPDVLEAGENPEIPEDTDGDNVPDYLDLDSDNDSINDVIEAGQMDEDGDGQVDPMSQLIDTPLDSDGDSVPDYQDTDSDNDGNTDIAEQGDPVLDQDRDGVIDKPLDGDNDGIPDVADGLPEAFGDALSDLDGIPAETELDIQEALGGDDISESQLDVDNDGNPDGPFSEASDIVGLYNCPANSTEAECLDPNQDTSSRDPIVVTVNKGNEAITSDKLPANVDLCGDVEFVDVRSIQENFSAVPANVGAGIVDVSASSIPSYEVSDDPEYYYPYGLVQYQILCREQNANEKSALVRLIYSGVNPNIDPSEYIIRKYTPSFAGGESAEINGTFSTLEEEVVDMAIVSKSTDVAGVLTSVDVLEITLLIQDDQLGDAIIDEADFFIFDPVGPALLTRNEDVVVSKKASSTDVGLGDIVKYTIHVDNNSDSLDAQGVKVFDKIDKGLNILTSTISVELDGVEQTITTTTETATTYGIGDFNLAPGSQLVVTYFAQVSAGATPGEYTNAAYVESTSIVGGKSNVAKAVINVAADPILDKSTIIGKVFFDLNGNGYPDQDEPGVSGARLGTVSGLLITTDKDGRYHLAGVDAGDRARFSNYSIKLDTASLPEGSQVITENPRVVRITGGMMNRFNFGISPNSQMLDIAKTAPVKPQEVVKPSIKVIPSAQAPQYKMEEKCTDEVVTNYQPVDSLITMVHFKNARNDINPEIIQRVASVLEVYKDKPNARIHVIGHTDSDVIRYPVTKIYENNYVLSMARAETVANYLRDNLGLDSTVLTTEGRGSDSPIAPNDTEEGEAMNRRTEIYVRYDDIQQSVVKSCEQVQVEVSPRIQVASAALNRISLNRSEANAVHDVTRFVINSNAFDSANKLLPQAANKITALKDVIWGAAHVELAILGENNAQVTQRMSAVDRLIMGNFQPVEQTKISLTPEVKQDVVAPVTAPVEQNTVPVEPNTATLNYNSGESVEHEVTQIVLSDNAYNADETLKDAAKVKLRKMYGIIWNAKAVKLVILGNSETQAVSRLNNTESFLNQILDKESMNKLMIEPQVKGVSTGQVNKAQSHSVAAGLSGWKKLAAYGISLLIPTAHALDENEYGACIAGICSDDMISIEVIKSDQEPFEKRIPATAPVKSSVATKSQAAFYSTEIFDVNPRLAVMGPETVYANHSGAFDTPTQFYIDSNYVDFIKDWTLNVYRDEERLHKMPIWQYKGDSFGRAVTWNGKTLDNSAIEAGDTLIYVLEVAGNSGAVDKTVERMITVHGIEDAHSSNAVIDSWITDIRQRNDLERSNILINGGQVTISGSGLPQGGALSIDGLPVAVDDSGNAQITLHKAIGSFAMPVRLVLDGNAFNTSMNGSLSEDYRFLTALADFTIGEGKVSGTDSWEDKIENDRQYDGDLYTDGRLAFYYKGRIQGKYLLTAQADTEEGDLETLFDNLGDKNAQSLLRRIDPDRFYPVYGDGSKVVDDTPSQGKFYVRLDWDRSNAAWGDFNTNLTGTELNAYNRTMYGAKLDYRSVPVTKFNESKYQTTLFASEPTSAAGYSEFLGTGGSLYYLRHNDVVLGSEKITVEVRDELTGEVDNRETLVLGRDYDFDAIQGRIILTRPLTDRVDDFAGPSIVDAQELNSGDKVYLIAEYEYLPSGFEDNNLNAGVRAKVWATDNIGIGATFINEENAANDFTKGGFDLTYKHSEGTYVRGEFSTSESGQTLDAFATQNGGINWASIDPRTDSEAAGTDGDAMLLEARLDLQDFGAQNHGEVEVFFKDKDAGFDSVYNAGTESSAYGARVNKDLGDNVNVKFEAVQADKSSNSSNTMTNRTIAAQVDWELLQDNLKLGMEVRNDTSEDDAALDSDVTYLGMRGDYKVTPNTNVYLKAQTVLAESDFENIQSNSENADQITAGVVSRLANDLHGRLEASSGDNGAGAKVGVNYSPLKGHDIYANYQLVDSKRRDGREDAFTIGHRASMSDRLDVYQEYRFDAAENSQRSENDKLWGLTYQLNEGWQLGANYQRSRHQNTALDTGNHNLFERDAATISVDYNDKDTRWGTRLEYRLDDELGAQSGQGQDLTQHVLVTKLRQKINNSWTFIGKAEYAETDLDNAPIGELDDNQARFVEADAGFAYRPVDNDKLNALFMYTYLYDLDPQFQEVSGTDEKSHIVSLDALYELTRTLELGGKLALKKKSFLVDRDDISSDWLESEVSLAILRLRYHLVKNWDIMGEYRLLTVDGEFANSGDESSRSGALVEVNRHIGDYMKAGVGYNFTDFSDDLRNEDYDAQGWFVNILGKY